MAEPTPTGNAFEQDMPGTPARDRSEGMIEGVRRLGGVFVDAVRASRMAMVLTDPTLPGNPIVFANQSFLDLSGYRMEEVLGQQPYFLNGPDTDPKDAARFRDILESDEDGVVETIQYARNGRRFVATVLLSAFKEEDGGTLHHFLTWTDVTRRVDAEGENAELRTMQEALRASERKYRSLFDSIDEGFCVIEVLFDDAGRPADYLFLEANPAFERQTGLVDAVGKRMRDLAPEHEQHWFDIYGRIATTGESQRFERRAEALGRWYDVYAFRIGRPDERRVAILFNDISVRRQTDAALRESEEKYRTLFESINEGFLIVEMLDDEHGRAIDYRFLEVNPAFERQSGLSNVIGRRAKEIAPDLEERWIRTSDHVARTGEPQRFEDYNVSTDRWYDFHLTRVGGPGSRRVCSVFSDISERKRNEAESRQSAERQGFLLALGDAMRAQKEASQKIEAASCLLGERLTASRVLFAEFDEDRDVAKIFTGWSAEGAQPFPTVMQLSDHEGPVMDDLRAGKVVRIDDVGTSGDQPAYAAIAALGVHALLSVPLVVDQKLIVNLSVHQHEPRRWTDQDVTLVREVAERLWAEVERARAEAALRTSEDRFRRFGEASQDVLWMRDSETLQWIYLTPAFETIYGFSREEALKGDNYRSWLDFIVPEDREHARQEIEKVRSGGHVTFEYRIKRRSDGRTCWLRETNFPVTNDAGKISWIGGIGHDVTELRESEERRRTSEERFGLIVENARDYAVFTTDPQGRIDRWYEGAAAVFGWTAEEAVGECMDITFTPEDRAKSEPEKERAGAAHAGRAADVRWHRRKDGERIFIDGITSALRGADGELTGFLKIGHDVTERRRAQERQDTLLAELQHRVRNIMAMIRSVARRTADSAETVEDYAQHLEGRISAMARTQALLTRDVHSAVDLQGLVLDELAMQAARPDQYRAAGPDVALPPKAAEVLGLALHELATNSVKYGALSATDGRIDVRWALLDGGQMPQLSLIWSEFGVRLDGSPRRSGFGTELITQRVPYELQGTGTIEFRSTGLVATLEFPLDELPSILQTDEGRQAVP